MIDIARPPSFIAHADRRRANPASPANRETPARAFWRRLDRLARMPVGEALRRLLPGRAAAAAAAPTHPFAPPRPPRAQARGHRAEPPAASASSVARPACLMPTWLSSVEIVELEMAEADRSALFGRPLPPHGA